jgi:rRNA-processing protein FCF1
MKVVVEDANVLLDLLNVGILGLWLGGNYEHLTTHLVRDEIDNEEQQKQIQLLIDAGKLILRSIESQTWPEIKVFSDQHRVSIPDACVWKVAKEEKAVLLTGDSKLRKAALATGVEVHGVLWILDELIKSNQIILSKACEALDVMEAKNAFLPRDECDKRRELWRCRRNEEIKMKNQDFERY